MSLTTIYNDSLFDILLKCIRTIRRTFSNVIRLFVPVGVLTTVFYAFHRIHEYRCKRLANVELTSTNRESRFEKLKRIRECSVIGHKNMLNALIQAANKSYEKSYALRCIDIVVWCPQLMNVKCPPYGLTAFHYVCLRGHDSLIAFMLAKGADVSIAAETGETALCMAVYYFLNEPKNNDFSRLDMLVQAGCGFGLENKWYDALLKIAITGNHTKLVEWLISSRSCKISRSVSASPQMNF